MRVKEYTYAITSSDANTFWFYVLRRPPPNFNLLQTVTSCSAAAAARMTVLVRNLPQCLLVKAVPIVPTAKAGSASPNGI